MSGEALRGLVVAEDDKATHSPSLVAKPRHPGTWVHYLDPDKFQLRHYADFLAELFTACRWRPSKALIETMPWSTALQTLRG
jgi:hypothetical protein